jgi:cytochrome d ubiquinol oxidase subunit I
MHLTSGIAVAVSGAASAFFVTLVSAFMNGPGGSDPIAAMVSPSWPYQVVHVLLSSYQATAWAMVAISAFILLRNPKRTLHRKALALA